MKAYFTFAFILIIATYSLFCVSTSLAQSFGIIYIRSNGNIEPTTAPIQREGNTYRLLDNVYNSPIVLEQNNIIFDGNGYALEGASQSIALNITCSNVTVINLVVLNWDAGILGAYNNVTIQNCNLTGNGKGIAIYADNYALAGNYIAQNKWGIRVQGNNIIVSENWLIGNSIGIWISSSFSQGSYNGNIITSNTFETNGKIAIETDLGGTFAVYHNNFIIPANQTHIVQTAYLAVPGDETKVVMPPWDNGKEGNYWSNYAIKYPNAVEIGSTGIYDTAYVVNIAPNLTDRYPLTNQIEASNVTLPTTSPSLTPLQSSTVTPSTTPTQLVTASPTLSPSPSIPEFHIWIIPVLLIASFIVLATWKKIK